MDTNRTALVKFIQSDSLYEVVKDTSLEEILFTEDYLLTLEEKRWYSTPEVADWFGINDGQLRYYIKPFHEYLFTKDTPSSSTAYRLNIESILKLRMILLLKDEYRVKGLQRLVGLGEGYVEKKDEQTSDIAIKVDLEKQVENLTKMMQQILKTGLFELKHGENSSELVIRNEYLTEQMNLVIENDKTISKVRLNAEEMAKDNADLQLQLSNLRKNDIAIRMKERRIELEITSDIKAEALQKWNEKNKRGLFSIIFHGSRIEIEKEMFIQAYLQEHFEERFSNVLNEYHNLN